MWVERVCGHLVRGRLSGRVALALGALDVQQDGLGQRDVVADVLQNGHEVVEIVGIWGPTDRHGRNPVSR